MAEEVAETEGSAVTVQECVWWRDLEDDDLISLECVQLPSLQSVRAPHLLLKLLARMNCGHTLKLLCRCLPDPSLSYPTLRSSYRRIIMPPLAIDGSTAR
jgi:hypothetical protein